MIKIYRKTATIKAEQFDEAKWQSIYNDSHNPEEWNIEARKFGIDHYHGYFIIPTCEGDMRIHDGDWIATGINGEHWPIADDIFKKTYAELPVIPKCVADWIEECKQKHISTGDMLCSERRPEQMRDWMALTPGTYQFDYARYHKYQELVARAWLDGYQVEAQHE